MGEIKSVKVDNWGVFFLQKLQNFFNKTDYCDLTLQFRDNSQLKVHRLVLSACTDFFNVLEQTCELTDDALVMPMELQADVVVPIVNFMYTGTLEFELRMYNKLLKTAKEMNMTVLLKLLQAHKRTMEGTLINSQNSQAGGGAKAKNKRLAVNTAPVNSPQAQQRRVLTEWPSTTPARRIISTKPVPPSSVFKQVNSSIFMKTSPKMQRGPTRYESTDPNIAAESYEPSFDAISYESKPLKEEPEDYDQLPSTPVKSRTSPFEQLRKGYNNNKRPAVSTFTSPPAKKPNIEDVKEFSEQQRMRKQIAAEYGDDAEYDGVMDDDIHNDDDDDEPSAAPSSSLSAKQQPGQHQASIIIKQSPNEKPTIVVKDSSNSKMDHAKIISEVLRQYPHLVKGNKNIKLKILPNAGGQPQKIVVKKEAADNAPSEVDQAKAAGIAQARQQLLQLTSPKQQTVLKPKVSNPGLTVTKVEAQTRAVASAVPPPAAPNVPPQKRRIDSKTMHALIAQGAENTTGPWLCLRCGVNGRPISIPSYRGFRRHLINTHKETIDSALCEHCGWRSTTTLNLNHHLWVEHKISTPLYVFPECEHCAKICVDQIDLDHHVRQVHPDAHKQQCIYCNKTFQQEMMLYNHMKTFHKRRAREDGVIDFSDDELGDFDEELKELAPEAATRPDKKIKILSDISLPSTILKLEEVSAAIEDEYAADGGGPKFVNADGNEMVLTAEQREEIMSQLEQDHDGGVVMVLNESAFPPGEGEALDHEAKQDITEDEFDDNQIYNEFPREENSDGVENASRADGSVKEEMGQEQDQQESEHDERADEDHMEWAENVISAHDAIQDKDDEEIDDDDEQEVGDEKNTSSTTDEQIDQIQLSSSKSESGTEKEEKNNSKKEEDISLKLKMLTGDWTDDEIEDEVEDPLLEKEKIAELLSSSGSVKTNENPTKSLKDKQKITSNESQKDETENEPIGDAVVAEEDISQSSEREEGEKKMHEEKEQLAEEDSNKSVEIKSEAQLSPSTIETSDEALKDEERTRRRSSSLKTDSMQSVNEEKKSSDESNEKDKSLNDNATTVIKVEADEDEPSTPDVKSDTNTETPAIDDSDKTADKVKTIMSEWAEDEDEV